MNDWWKEYPSGIQPGDLTKALEEQAAIELERSWEYAEKPPKNRPLRTAKINEVFRKALQEIAELEGDCENQQFKLTRFQASQIARKALNEVNLMRTIKEVASEIDRIYRPTGWLQAVGINQPINDTIYIYTTKKRFKKPFGKSYEGHKVEWKYVGEITIRGA